MKKNNKRNVFYDFKVISIVLILLISWSCGSNIENSNVDPNTDTLTESPPKVDLDNNDGEVSVSDDTKKAKAIRTELELRIRLSAHNDSLINKDSSRISANDKLRIKNYVVSFYQSLELSKEETQKAYETGANFSNDTYKQFLSSAKSYNKKRVGSLTGIYHTHFYIELLGIEDIYIKDNLFCVQTLVFYSIFENGDYTNKEEVQIKEVNNALILINWFDIQPLKVNKGGPDQAEAYGTENLKPADLYLSLGENLK